MSQHTQTIVVSASLAMVATSAMAHAGETDRVAIPKESPISEELSRQIDAALAKKSVREAVSDIFGVLVKSYTDEDGATLSERYFPGQSEEFQMAQVSDSTAGEGLACYSNCYGNCYNNCHGACHGACHGSRGWR